MAPDGASSLFRLRPLSALKHILQRTRARISIPGAKLCRFSKAGIPADRDLSSRREFDFAPICGQVPKRIGELSPLALKGSPSCPEGEGAILGISDDHQLS